MCVFFDRRLETHTNFNLNWRMPKKAGKYCVLLYTLLMIHMMAMMTPSVDIFIICLYCLFLFCFVLYFIVFICKQCLDLHTNCRRLPVCVRISPGHVNNSSGSKYTHTHFARRFRWQKKLYAWSASKINKKQPERFHFYHSRIPLSKSKRIQNIHTYKP